MKTTIKEELTSYVLELINDKVLTDDNRDDIISLVIIKHLNGSKNIV
jgi:hypothetical protein